MKQISVGDFVSLKRNIPKPSFNDQMSENYKKTDKREHGTVLKKFRNGWIVKVGQHEFFMEEQQLG